MTIHSVFQHRSQEEMSLNLDDILVMGLLNHCFFKLGEIIYA